MSSSEKSHESCLFLFIKIIISVLPEVTFPQHFVVVPSWFPLTSRKVSYGAINFSQEKRLYVTTEAPLREEKR